MTYRRWLLPDPIDPAAVRALAKEAGVVRFAAELPVRAGGVATAEQMRIAAGRPAGKFALSGFTGGTAKRFKRWAAATPGAEGLTLPVTTVYDPSIKGRQRAKAFKVEEQLVPLFRISLMQTQD